MAVPDFFILGAPKAGTTALHAALARHPGLFLSPVKEPKFYLCGEQPPDRSRQRGPGDAHSAQEWIWRRDRYEALFAAAPPGTLRGESTPFYLYDRQAQRRIRREVPQARLIAVLRDPVDRAYSNWMHLWSDGLEPIPSLLPALRAEDRRVAAGWAPFWHYRRLGCYGEQLRHLFTLFPADQVHVLRYRDLVDDPHGSVDQVCEFLGVPPAGVIAPRPENVRPLVPDIPSKRALARAVRAGAWAGQFLPPQAWRVASRPILRALHRGGNPRPHLEPAERAEAIELFRDDVAVLEEVTGASYSDWVDGPGRGAFSHRRQNRAAGPDQPE